MTGNLTLNCNEPFIEGTFEAQIRQAFACESRKPGKPVLSFILGFAAAYESMRSEVLGTVDIMKN